MTPRETSPASAIPAQKFECPNLECGAVFSYRRISCGHFAPPRFCPDCGQPMSTGSVSRSPASRD